MIMFVTFLVFQFFLFFMISSLYIVVPYSQEHYGFCMLMIIGALICSAIGDFIDYKLSDKVIEGHRKVPILALTGSNMAVFLVIGGGVALLLPEEVSSIGMLFMFSVVMTVENLFVDHMFLSMFGKTYYPRYKVFHTGLLDMD